MKRPWLGLLWCVCVGAAAQSLRMRERLGVTHHDGEAVLGWDANLWQGTGDRRWQLRSEGHGNEVTGEGAAWRAVSPWSMASVGWVYDRQQARGRAGLQLGLAGLLPYRIAMQSGLWLTTQGDVALRMELEQDVLFTQRLLLQPRVEARAWTDGRRSAELGLRLRYELRREIAPYLGVSRQWDTDVPPGSSSGSAAQGWQVVVGLRAWF